MNTQIEEVEITAKELSIIELEFGSLRDLVIMVSRAYHPTYIFSKFFDSNYRIDPTAKDKDKLELKIMYEEFVNFSIDLINKGQQVKRPSKKAFSRMLKARGAELRKGTGNVLYIHGVKRK